MRKTSVPLFKHGKDRDYMMHDKHTKTNKFKTFRAYLKYHSMQLVSIIWLIIGINENEITI